MKHVAILLYLIRKENVFVFFNLKKITFIENDITYCYYYGALWYMMYISDGKDNLVQLLALPNKKLSGLV